MSMKLLHVSLIVLLTLSVLGATAERKSWQWSVEERIALRTSPAAAKERVGEAKHGSKVTTNQASGRAIVDSFDGRTHPELFLPHEVFDELVTLAFAGSPRTRELMRESFSKNAAHYGLPATFLDELESMTSVYVADQHALRDLGSGYQAKTGVDQSRTDEAIVLKQRDVCSSGAQAFAAARKAFGKERLERFLYDVVAVHMVYAADRLPDAESLREIEGGCG
jgi:hypothetical protein